jgi:hypothetical protein
MLRQIVGRAVTDSQPSSVGIQLPQWMFQATDGDAGATPWRGATASDRLMPRAECPCDSFPSPKTVSLSGKPARSGELLSLHGGWDEKGTG